MNVIAAMTDDIDASARIADSSVGRTEIREYVTIHDSEIGDGCRIYERSSLKKCRVGDGVDINAGTYVENADIDADVQIGPNCSVVGVTHELDERGMEHRDDVFERIRVREGAFVGAGAVVAPGVEIGAGSVVAAGATVHRDVDAETIVLGTPPTQTIADLEEWVDG